MCVMKISKCVAANTSTSTIFDILHPYAILPMTLVLHAFGFVSLKATYEILRPACSLSQGALVLHGVHSRHVSLCGLQVADCA